MMNIWYNLCVEGKAKLVSFLHSLYRKENYEDVHCNDIYGNDSVYGNTEVGKVLYFLKFNLIMRQRLEWIKQSFLCRLTGMNQYTPTCNICGRPAAVRSESRKKKILVLYSSYTTYILYQFSCHLSFTFPCKILFKRISVLYFCLSDQIMCFEKLLLKFCSNYKVVKLLNMFISCFIVIVFVISYWTTAQGVLILFIKNDI